MAAALGGASAAWACTPVSEFFVRDAQGNSEGPPDGTVTVMAVYNGPVSGDDIVITDESMTVEIARATVPVAPAVNGIVPIGPGRTYVSGPAQVQGVGYYKFHTYEVAPAATTPRGPVTEIDYRVREAVSTEPVDPGSTPGARPGTKPGSALGSAPGSVQGSVKAPPPAAVIVPGKAGAGTGVVGRPSSPSGAQTTAPRQPAPAPAASMGATIPAQNRTPPAASTKAVPTVSPSDGSIEPSIFGQPLLPPLPSNLWGGLDPSAGTPSLLNSPTTTSGGGLPVGGALLGLGVLGLAGVAAVTGRRKLALARTSRS